MTIMQELTAYAKDCISGKIISCTKHKWACERFLNDVKRAKSKNSPFCWDEREAQNIVDWFGFLRHSKGVLAGEPIKLLTCQKFDLCQIYGWIRTDGTRRFRTSFVEKARKNAKSQEEAGVALYELSRTATKNNEVYEAYSAGTKRDQSKIVFEECKNLLRGSPLSLKFSLGASEIRHIKTGSTLKALSKDDKSNGDGTNPALLVLDEYHQHRTTEFYDLGIGGNTKEPLLMIITTAGKDLNVPCYTQEYDFVSNLLNPDMPDVINDAYFADIYEAEPDTELTDDTFPLLAEMANPVRWTYTKGRELITEAYTIAKEMPDKMTTFMTKCLNIWLQAQQNRYMDMKKWNLCRVESLPISLRGLDVYVGFDMSAKIDLTSVAFIIPFMDGECMKYVVFSHSFIPNKQKLIERMRTDKMPYDAWVRNGYITITNSEIVDQNAVMRYVFDFCRKHELNIKMLCFDPHNSAKLMLELSDEGHDVVEVYQSAKSLNEATVGFREQVFCRNILFLNNPVLNFAMGNAVEKRLNGLIRIDKDASIRRIDPVASALAAFKLAMYHEFDDDIEQSNIDWLEESW